MKIRSSLALATAAGTALALAACGGNSNSSGNSTAALSDANANITVGIKFDQPGMGLNKGGTYSGFDVDVANYIAKALGKEGKVTFKEAVSSQRETLIKTGQVLYVVGTYTINDKRKQEVGFAGPYFVAGQDLLVKADNTSITGVDSLNGKKLCSVKGSTSATNVKAKIPGVQLQEYDSYSKCAAEVAAGTVDALTTDNTILAGYAAQAEYKGKLKLVGKTFSEEPYGVGLKKGDTELCNKITDALKKMISDGSWKTAVEKNLGPAGFTVPTPPTPTCQA